MDAITLPQYVQGVYILASATALFVNAVPHLQSRFLRYGKTITPISNADTGSRPKTNNDKEEAKPPSNIYHKLLDYLETLQVPHAYFGHFYIISVVSSLFWCYQIATKGHAIRLLVYHTAPQLSRNQSMEQVMIGCAFVLVQGARRLYEHYYITKKSNSTMWCVHWFLGWMFYVALGIAIWAEGAGTILSPNSGLTSISLTAPSLKSTISIPLFILASGLQHDCHRYLSSLKKYTLPNEGLFQLIICPHYFAECLIYLSLSILTAPKGYLVNKTVFTALIFVVSNLGVTAGLNKEWYIGKFGVDSVKGRWKMIPFIY